MPMTHAMKQSAAGEKFVRTHQAGKVTGADAKHFMQLLAPGQPLHGLPVLAVLESGSELDADARKMFTAMNEPAAKAARVAVVVSSAPLRVMMSFVIRMSGSSEAQSWLFAKA